MIPLSLYIHIPWCERKCPYCDFNSYEGKPDTNLYIHALLMDLDNTLPVREIQSIFIGGGTPSLFSVDAIAHLLEGIKARAKLAAGVEITLEANPGTSEANRFAGYRKAGVNRLSIGIQSLNDGFLKALGRIHDKAQAISAYEQARNAGFENINLDLMYALPGQNLKEALDELDQLIDLQPEHISWYQLTIEENTPFAKHTPPDRANDDQQAQMMQAGTELISRHGYDRYEVSAFARAEKQCLHNLNYWRFGDYIGIGAGAHSKLTGPDGRVLRQVKKSHPKAYLGGVKNQDFISEHNHIELDMLITEFMLNALRLNDGFELSLFTERTGIGTSEIEKTINKAAQAGLITIDHKQDKIIPTPRGIEMLNSLIALF